MEAYSSFAQVYDLFMDNVPYEKWSKRIAEILAQFHISDGLLLDLGCGTGKLSRLMEQRGFDMIAIDNSFEMLDMARRDSSEKILYLMQDMREFELYGTVKGVYSACDCINYILDEEELRKVFSLVNNYLDPQGIFIFDFNTLYKYEELLAENTFAENREEGSFIWENYYDKEEQINEYDLTLYIKDKEQQFSRFQETHYQRGYALEQIKNLLEEAGLAFVAAYDDYSDAAVHKQSERIVVVARECQK